MTTTTTDAPAEAPAITPEAVTPAELKRRRAVSELVGKHTVKELKAMARELGVIVSGSRTAIAEEIVAARRKRGKGTPSEKPAKAAKASKTAELFTVEHGGKKYELTVVTRPYELKDGETYDRASNLVLNRFGRPKKFQPTAELRDSAGKVIRRQA